MALIDFTPYTRIPFTNKDGTLTASAARMLLTALVPRVGGVTGDVTASTITNTPAGSIAATTVQGALNELDTEKQPLDATLTAFAGLTIAASKVPYGTGSDAFSLLDLDTDGTLAANSDTRLATQKAVKTYADGLVAANDAMVFKGVIDCSANPNYPAASRGDTYRVSVAGKIGGASGTNVEAGDILLCLTDGTASGTQAAVGASWSVVQANIDGAVVGPASSTSGNIATFNGTSGKTIQDGGKALPSGDVVGTSDSQALTNKSYAGSTVTMTGAILSSGGGVGYTTGAGGAVTQATNKATGVTLDELCGEITMNGAALASSTAVTFTLTNSTIAAGDRLVLNHASAGTFGAYHIDGRSAAGSADIVVRNLTAGSLSEAIVIGFAVIKGVTS